MHLPHWRPARWMKPEAEGLSQCFECWQISKQITKCILILCQKAERTSREHLILTDIQIQKQRFSLRWERQRMPPSLSPSFSAIILINAAVTRGQQEIIINNPQPTRNHGITELIYHCASGVGEWPLFGLFWRSIHNIVTHMECCVRLRKEN